MNEICRTPQTRQIGSGGIMARWPSGREVKRSRIEHRKSNGCSGQRGHKSTHPVTIRAIRVLITGDRFWNCHLLAAPMLRRLIARYGPHLTIVHGDATGVDESFGTAARGLGLAVEAHPVTDEERRTVGKGASPQRNAHIVAPGADLCITVHRYISNSKGARDCALKTIAA